MSGKRSTILLKGFLISHKDFSIESVSRIFIFKRKEGRKRQRGRGKREGKEKNREETLFLCEINTISRPQ